MPERIVLFGGTFNPIHHGHLIAARAVAEYFHFERITLVPAASPPHKPMLDLPQEGEVVAKAPTAEDRMEMVRLAVEGEELFEISDIELNRRPPSYTFDTLMALRDRHGLEAKLYWVVGADMLADLPNWHRATEVVDMATIITAARPPWTEKLGGILENLAGRFRPDQLPRLEAAVAPTPLIDITSTQIRHRVRAGRSIRYLAPDAVIDYIARKGLYRQGASP
ncbi:MAG TPA: nicotinate-nucleotide adenylyltransferase [Phycisphaerae bacterium]|nr:nicotinate-nucleotide adenylyltransferase [Phycisphaerae bacterium]